MYGLQYYCHEEDEVWCFWQPKVAYQRPLPIRTFKSVGIKITNSFIQVSNRSLASMESDFKLVIPKKKKQTQVKLEMRRKLLENEQNIYEKLRRSKVLAAQQLQSKWPIKIQSLQLKINKSFYNQFTKLINIYITGENLILKMYSHEGWYSLRTAGSAVTMLKTTNR